MDEPKIGDTFHNRYVIVSKLGVGGMGNVFRATQIDANRATLPNNKPSKEYVKFAKARILMRSAVYLQTHRRWVEAIEKYESASSVVSFPMLPNYYYSTGRLDADPLCCKLSIMRCRNEILHNKH